MSEDRHDPSRPHTSEPTDARLAPDCYCGCAVAVYTMTSSSAGSADR